MPSAPPTWRSVIVSAVPEPAWSGGSSPSTASIAGASAEPDPEADDRQPGRRPTRTRAELGGRAEARPPAMTRSPAATGIRVPMRADDPVRPAGADDQAAHHRQQPHPGVERVLRPARPGSTAAA